jgi:hypothetical protein
MRGAFANLRNAAAEASKEAAASLRAGAKELAAASKEALKEAGSRTKALSEVVAAKVEVAAVAGAEKTRALAAVAADKTSALGDRAAKALAERASQASAAFSSKLDHSGHGGACTPTVALLERKHNSVVSSNYRSLFFQKEALTRTCAPPRASVSMRSADGDDADVVALRRASGAAVDPTRTFVRPSGGQMQVRLTRI